MKKDLRESAITVAIYGTIIGVLFGGGFLLHKHQMNELFDKKYSTKFDIKKDSLEEIISNADEIKMEKQIFSLKKHYFVLVDDVVVAEITGKYFPIFGDEVTVRDINNKIIKTETQIKRLGPTNGKVFNFSINRVAQIKDKSGNITGYIKENRLRNLFSLIHKQYFLDENENTIAQGTQRILSKDFTIKDNRGKTIYKIDGNLLSIRCKSTIKKVADTELDEIDVILYNIIEDSIINGRKSSSSSKSKQ